ncbi:MAG: DUF547 domain-containing protein [Salinibacter sp.]
MSLRSLPAVMLVVSLTLYSGPALGQMKGQMQGRAAGTLVSQSPGDRHAQFSRLLARYVDEQGRVDYARLRQHADTTLTPYLRRLAATNPARLSRDARLAFWINAYNALALKLILDHYPVETIWATTAGPAKPSKKNSPFQMEVGAVADTVRTLDEIEHRIIRERFDEPRIHFAVVCAAVSCPPLRREAYTGPRLDAQLDDQARTFLHNEQKNRIPAGEDRIALTRILKWYGDDFGPSTDAVQKYIARYFEGTVRKRLAQADYKVDFLSYDWSLNDQESETRESTVSSN